MDKQQATVKPCETCGHEEKSGAMYPCAVCRGSDKWEAKKETIISIGGFVLAEQTDPVRSVGGEAPKRPASLLALTNEIVDSLISWRDGGENKNLRKAQRILTVLLMLEEGDVED